MMTSSDMERTVEFFIMKGQTPDWIERITRAGIAPQELANIIANAMQSEGFNNDNSIDCIERLRDGEMNSYIAERLGYGL